MPCAIVKSRYMGSKNVRTGVFDHEKNDGVKINLIDPRNNRVSVVAHSGSMCHASLSSFCGRPLESPLLITYVLPFTYI